MSEQMSHKTEDENHTERAKIRDIRVLAGRLTSRCNFKNKTQK
jgi:hypothetical protein